MGKYKHKTQQCVICKHWKSLGGFRRGTRDKRHTVCRECEDVGAAEVQSFSQDTGASSTHTCYRCKRSITDGSVGQDAGGYHHLLRCKPDESHDEQQHTRTIRYGVLLPGAAPTSDDVLWLGERKMSQYQSEFGHAIAPREVEFMPVKEV